MKSLAGETDVPIFVTFVDSVFAGQTSDMVQLKYTWVISDKITEVKSGDKFGIFEVDTEQPLTLDNDGSLSLSRDSTVNLAGNMKFKVADSEDDDVRFYPFVEITTPGTVEVRGTVSQFIGDNNFSVMKWDATNFAGFWYDIDDNKQTENLNILKFKDSRSIDKDGLVYSTGRASQEYKVFEEEALTIEHGLDKNLNKPSSPARGGFYALVGWMAEKYVGVNGKNNKLARLILEQDTTDKRSLQVGEKWDLGEGYSLTAQSIDAKATPRQAWLVLSKNDVKLDDKVIAQGEVYTYSMKSIAGETDVPIFVTFVDSVFAGQTSDMVQLKFTWVISDKITEVKSGDSFGVFEVDTEQPLTLSNDASISLSRESTVSLAGNMKFKVADSEDDDVRFYPKVDYQLGNVTETPTPPVTVTGNQTPVPTITGNQTPVPTVTGATPPPTEKGETTPIPTATKPSPGFEAIVAIVGLLAVAYIVLRQKK
jgi:S-layer protein (TIGR01567 family)